MEKYKKLLEEIICDKVILKSDFKQINNVIFYENGVVVFFEYYSHLNQISTDKLTIYNSEINSYMYEKLK